MEPENPGTDAGVIGTSPLNNVAPDGTALRDYLTVTLGDTAGWLCADVGHGGRFAQGADGRDKYKHVEWIPRVYSWPGDADRAVLELSREAHLADVYLTPYVMANAKRAAGGSAARPLVHTDVDAGLDLAKVAALGGYVVASGSGEGHGHVYVPLTESVPLHWHRALEIGLRDALGGDDKISDNDLLRPVGTLNHKPAAAGGDPAAVTWLLPPTGERVDPHTLAHKLGVTLVESPPPTMNNGAAVGVASAAIGVTGAHPLDLGAYPDVLAAIGRNTGDRSEDTARVIGACIDSGLTLPQTRSAVAVRLDLCERLAERRDDDVLTTWLKIVDDRQSRRWLGAGIGPLGAGGPAAPPQPAELSPGVLDGAAFVLDQPDTVPAQWGTGNTVLWAQGEALMVAGGMGLGKTTLAGQLVRGLVFGGDVLGLPVNGAKETVLYLAMDRPRQIARSMRRQFGECDRAALAQRLIVRPGPPPADMAQNPAILLALAEHHNAGIVFVDSLKDAAVGLAEDAVGAAYNRARQMLLASGRQVCELHHSVKRGPNGAAPSGIADIFGSVWLTAGAGSVVLLTGEPGDPIVGFRHVKQPAEEVGPYRLLHDQTAGVLSIDHAADLVALVNASGPDGLTAKGAAMAIFEKKAPTRAEIQKARRKLDDLVTAGRLTRMEGGKGSGHTTAWFAA